MLKTIILNNIQQFIFSLKLQIILVIIMLVFIVGSIAFVFQYRSARADYIVYSLKAKEEMQRNSEMNVTEVVVFPQDFIFGPLQNGFIDDAKSQFIPNTINLNAYNVFGYSISRRSGNPYLHMTNELNWLFIISIIVSFAILILSFDSISGEREMHTLSLMLSNSVSRAALLAGKFLSIVITGFIMTLPGIIISLVILFVSGTIILNLAILFEICAFLLAELFFVACISSLGLFCTVVSRQANIGLLLCLTFWSVFLIFSPNLAVFSAENIFRIKNSEVIQAEVKTTQDAINNAAPEGSWSMNSSSQFYPKHELRAKNQSNLMNAEKAIKDAWYNDQFRQYQQATLFTCLSPVSLFEMISESITGSGFMRFQNVWNDLHLFQTQFLNWFKVIDIKDPTSPHWYNPYEDCSTSRQKVRFEEIPRFNEKFMTIPQRLSGAIPGLTLLIIYSMLLFGITIVLFNRYDVR